MSDTRLIEVAFPLKQASLDSVHEKNVRHGHISTLHIWPARRPLAASRAALIATLLPDPGNVEERRKILERLAGKVVQKTKKQKGANGKVEERTVEETVGGILHWGRESGPDLDWFREQIRAAYGGRAPRVLDPFAGGGAIPLEAMRLGCEVTAVDINPVAWFILKCTLEYPQKLAGQKLPLPAFALEDEEFMEQFRKAHGLTTKTSKPRAKKQVKEQPATYEVADQHVMFETPTTYSADIPEADLAWHVRAWGRWVLQRARADLERFYPTLDGKPTVAYLWARTVRCKNCRATIPLLKTRWLCKKDNKRVVLTVEPNADRTGVVFGVQKDVSMVGGNAAQRREYDKKIGQGTMSSKGVWCPCCGKPGTVAMTMDDIRQEAVAGNLGATITVTVVTGSRGKEYRQVDAQEFDVVAEAKEKIGTIFGQIPYGLPQESTPGPAGPKRKSSSLRIYGMNQWTDIFTPRQLYSIGSFVLITRETYHEMIADGYPTDWAEAIFAYLTAVQDRMINYCSTICIWEQGLEQVKQTFLRFAFPITWDYAEANPCLEADKYYLGALNASFTVLDETLSKLPTEKAEPEVICESSINYRSMLNKYDVIMTDPPYYDAIFYSDLMDFFHVWLRRTFKNILGDDFDRVFQSPLTTKWKEDQNDGELVDDPGRHQWNLGKSKYTYEDGMHRTFCSCYESLNSDGRLVIVFAHKHPDAWETLVSALIRSGFVVNGSWPIMTEMRGGIRNFGRASLSSSVWLVCKKRAEAARPGWDNRVLEEMRTNIATRLRDFWDAGIRGPDFVWAATGPALEAYSKHPVVKKANQPGELMDVGEFLSQVRRIVVDFVVGRVLGGEDAEVNISLDDVTTYYLLHRHDFGMGDAPAGACILYAVSCGLSDTALANQWNLLARTGGKAAAEAEDDEEAEGDEDAGADVEETEGSGSTMRLKSWQQRKHKSLGIEAPGGRPVPLIDQVHRLMHLWKAGEVAKVDEYLDARALRRNQLFHQLLQALIELAPAGADERALLESISNHVAAKGAAPQLGLFDDTPYRV